MMVSVRFFARARELAAADELRVELPRGATIGELRHALGHQIPRLVGLLERSALAMNDEFAGDEASLVEGAEIAVLPPVSGGELRSRTRESSEGRLNSHEFSYEDKRSGKG